MTSTGIVSSIMKFQWTDSGISLFQTIRYSIAQVFCGKNIDNSSNAETVSSEWTSGVKSDGKVRTVYVQTDDLIISQNEFAEIAEIAEAPCFETKNLENKECANYRDQLNEGSEENHTNKTNNNVDNTDKGILNLEDLSILEDNAENNDTPKIINTIARETIESIVAEIEVRENNVSLYLTKNN